MNLQTLHSILEIKDTGTVLSIRKLVYEDDYTGETDENDFVQFTEEIGNGWSVFY